MKRRIVSAGFAVLIIVLSMLNLNMGTSRKKEEKQQAEESIPVRVMKVKLQTIQKTLDYVDDVKAKDEAQVYPKVNGKIIEKTKEDGSVVSKGDVIAYIDRDEVGLKYEKAPVESPLSGIIGRVYVDKGTSVTPQTPIALVIDIDEVKINLDIPEKYLPQISKGQDAMINVDAYPNEIFSGEVSKISPVVDLSTRTAPIEIIIPNADHRLKPGMFARVQLVINEKENIPVILKEAVMGKGEYIYVYIIENNKAFLKRIVIGIRQGNFVEVSNGLKAGELVVVMGQQRLYDGAPVLAEEGEANQ